MYNVFKIFKIIYLLYIKNKHLNTLKELYFFRKTTLFFTYCVINTETNIGMLKKLKGKKGFSLAQLYNLSLPLLCQYKKNYFIICFKVRLNYMYKKNSEN